MAYAALYCMSQPATCIVVSATVRSIGDVGLKSGSIVSFNDDTPLNTADNSFAEVGDKDTSSQANSSSVRWKDQNGTTSKDNTLSPHAAQGKHVGSIARNISSISERSELTDVKI